MTPHVSLLLMGLLLLASPLSAQSVRSLVHGGNDMYDDKKFSDAEVNYRKALEKENGLVQGHFNLGDALYKQQKYGESAKEFENAYRKADSKDARAFAQHNIGNSLVKEQKYAEAIKAYTESLKIHPDDLDTKYNLSYAMAMMHRQQENQNKKNNQQKNKDDQNNQDQKKQNQQEQNQQKQNQEKQDREKQQAQQREKQMAKADAERILDVLKNNEKNVQKKLRVRQATRVKTDKDW